MSVKRIQFLAIVLLLQFSVSFSQNELPLNAAKKFTSELSFGPVQNFSTGEAAFMAVDSISSDKIVFVYRDWDNSGFGTAVIGTVDNLGTTYGNPVVFAEANVFLPSVKVLNDSIFFVIYRNMDQAGSGFIVKGEIENENIFFGSPLIFSTAMISTSSLIFMDDSDFIIAFKDNGNNGYGTLLQGIYSNGNIVLGENIVFNEATSFENELTRLTDSTFIITYRDTGNEEKGTIKVGTLQNDLITFSSPYVFSATQATDVSVASLSSNSFIVSYSSGTGTGEAVKGEYPGEEVIFSTPFAFSLNEVSGTSVTILADSIAIFSYTDGGDNNFGTSVLAHINNSVITYDEPVVFNTSGSFTTHGVRLSDSTFVLAFRNEGSSFFGSAVIGKVTVDQTTDIQFYSTSSSIRVFPNPTNGIFTVEGNEITQCEIMNLAGQPIAIISPFEGKNMIDISEFDKGVYLLKTRHKNIITVSKIILK